MARPMYWSKWPVCWSRGLWRWALWGSSLKLCGRASRTFEYCSVLQTSLSGVSSRCWGAPPDCSSKFRASRRLFRSCDAYDCSFRELFGSSGLWDSDISLPLLCRHCPPCACLDDYQQFDWEALQGDHSVDFLIEQANRYGCPKRLKGAQDS